jgi:DNA-directed RNA polymerase specialized sigma subunit
MSNPTDSNESNCTIRQKVKSEMQNLLENILPSWPLPDQQLFSERFLMNRTEQEIGDARGMTQYEVQRQIDKLMNRIITNSVHGNGSPVGVSA